MSERAIYLILLLLFILFIGEPDLHDAIIHKLMN